MKKKLKNVYYKVYNDFRKFLTNSMTLTFENKEGKLISNTFD